MINIFSSALVPYVSNQDGSIGDKDEKFHYPQLEYIPEVEEFQEMEPHTEPMGMFYLHMDIIRFFLSLTFKISMHAIAINQSPIFPFAEDYFKFLSRSFSLPNLTFTPLESLLPTADELLEAAIGLILFFFSLFFRIIV